MNGFTFYHNGKDYFFTTSKQKLTNGLIAAIVKHLGVFPQSDKECQMCKRVLCISPAVLEICKNANGTYYKIRGARNRYFGITGFPEDTIIINLEDE